MPMNDNITLLVDRVKVSSLHNNPFEGFTGVKAGPVTSSISHILMMVCCLFSVADRARLCAGCGLEPMSLWRLLACSTVRNVLVVLFI